MGVTIGVEVDREVSKVGWAGQEVEEQLYGMGWDVMDVEMWV